MGDMHKMHDAVLKYIAFDERVFQNGPVLLDDGLYSHCLVPDEDDYLPVLKDHKNGSYCMMVSARDVGGETALVFSVYSGSHEKTLSRTVVVRNLGMLMLRPAGRDELAACVERRFTETLEDALKDWFSDIDGSFFDTLGMFTRVAIEDTYGSLTAFNDCPAARPEDTAICRTVH